MSVDPTTIVGEVLGEPAPEMNNPANADYQCPFINGTCVKRSQVLSGPYPLCSTWHNAGRVLVCNCPKRFFEIDFVADVIQHCWPGEKPTTPHVVHEVKMADFGNVDFVIADVATDGSISQFVSVELQAIDNSGSVMRAYLAHVNCETLHRRPSYGLNYANVYKRLSTQLIAKGYFHHHWGTRVVAVIQDVVLKDIERRTSIPAIPLEQANIVFMSYRYERDEQSGHFSFKLDRVLPTHHSNLQSAILYRTAPSKDEFCNRIRHQLQRTS